MKMRTLPRCMAGLSILAVSGCGLVLGLDDFKDAAPADGATSAGAGAGGAGSGGGPSCEPESVAECYSGPPATEGVGICQAGTQACKQDGSGYEACSGEVTTEAETCASTEDEDCDGKDCEVWAVSFGGELRDEPTGLAIDSSGNSYVIGEFSGRIDVSGFVLSTTAGKNIFLVKIGPDGKPLWARQYGAADGSEAMLQVPSAIVLDRDGNVFAAGFSSEPFSLGGNLIDRGHFVAKFDPDGQHVWSKHLTGACLLARVSSLATTAQGDLLVTGSFCGSIDLGDGAIPSQGADVDVFLAKLSGSDGSGRRSDGFWGKAFGGEGAQLGTRVMVDPAGNIWLAGNYARSIDFGLGSLPPADRMDAYVVKFSSDGVAVSDASFHGSGIQTVTGAALDEMGGPLLAVAFDGSVNTGAGTFVSDGSDSYLIKLSSQATYQWAKLFGGAGDYDGGELAYDRSGDVFFSGAFDGDMSIGGEELSASGDSSDIFVVKLTRLGQPLWSRRFGSPEGDRVLAIKSDSLGDPVIVGTVWETVDFGGGALATNGGADVFVAKLSP
ncbi:SBBP repeat-containing protein [Sorangium sp. So ce119]|uniref:SBBP repeat-containing protein n=1 Tax=Sorangium sp. So ce119 TaxID=3133279 RepID=UPI003F60560C